MGISAVVRVHQPTGMINGIRVGPTFRVPDLAVKHYPSVTVYTRSPLKHVGPAVEILVRIARKSAVSPSAFVRRRIRVSAVRIQHRRRTQPTICCLNIIIHNPFIPSWNRARRAVQVVGNMNKTDAVIIFTPRKPVYGVHNNICRSRIRSSVDTYIYFVI